MPALNVDQEQALGITPPPPGVPEIDPKTKVTRLATVDHSTFRKRMKLSEKKLAKVKGVLTDSYMEWERNTSALNAKLRKYNNRLEGVSTPKTYPWPGACSLSIPLTELHILSLHALVESTILDNDPIWTIKEMLPATNPNEKVDPNLQWFLSFKAKQELKLDERLSEIYYNAFQHPLAIGVLDWKEEIGRQFQIEVFNTIEDFQQRFPSAEDAGVSPAEYRNNIDAIKVLKPEEAHSVRVEEDVVRYRGPAMRIVELKDLVRCPVGAPNLSYTIFHGDRFRQRANWIKVRANSDEFDSKEVSFMLKSPAKTSAADSISEQQDRIEGISSSRTKSDEYDLVRGNLRIALDDDTQNDAGEVTEFAEERLYYVVFHPESKALLRIEEYPYWHNRENYIPFRIRKRTNRLLGRCITDMLWDINTEVDTQHQMRIDSRAITTVPSFLKLMSETGLDLSRKDQHFYPGVTFTVNNKDGFKQLDIKQTDMGSSLQEEQTLFQVAEWLVGNSPSLRSGSPTAKDPRASGKKAQVQLGQSNIRVDDYIRELCPSTNEVGSQMLELYYQFSPGSLIPYAQYDQGAGQWLKNDINRAKLRNRNMQVMVARSSMRDNPDAELQRAMTFYQTFQKEPMVGGVQASRYELIRRTLFAAREKDINKILPPMDQLMKSLQAQQGAAQQDPAAAQMHEDIHGKAGKPEDEDNKTGVRQGGPDNSQGALGKKG